MNEYRLSNGLVVPKIGYGTFPLKERLVESVPISVRSGYRLIDTSDYYQNERFVGSGLMTCGEARADVVVVTKFSNPLKTGAFESCFERSRERLGGRIDVYLLHWAYPFLWREQWHRMEDLYLEGRCRAIGVCNFDRRKLEALLKFCRVKPMRGLHSMTTSPLSVDISPRMILKSVDLPLPFGPTTPTRSPLLTRKVTSVRTSWCP